MGEKNKQQLWFQDHEHSIISCLKGFFLLLFLTGGSAEFENEAIIPTQTVTKLLV